MKKNFTKQDFYDMLKPNGDCLEWTGSKQDFRGYGKTWVDGKRVRTHRLALELEGIDTTGFHVLHSCDNTSCCNPKHLRLGTQKDNMQDVVVRNRGNKKKGSSHHRSKLVESQVIEIKQRILIGETYASIASDYGVDTTCIGLIKRGVTWSHL